MKSDKVRRFLHSVGFKLIAVSLIFIGLAVLADLSIRPLVETVNAYECRNRVTEIINDAIMEELSREEVDYARLVTLTSNAEGEIVSVESNVVNINKLKTGISSRMERELQCLSAIDITIPVGTITGLQFLYGKGFDMVMSLTPLGHAATRIISEFSEAGINQTRHRIIIEIIVNIKAVVPGYSTEVKVVSSVIAAETIIVGRVPDAYTHVVSSDEDLIGTLEDYGAEEN